MALKQNWYRPRAAHKVSLRTHREGEGCMEAEGLLGGLRLGEVAVCLADMPHT